MKIKELRLKGFEGIRRGLGLEEIKIDFSDAMGLIALAGQNGLGKSTVLENMQPFNMLVSRDGALFNHCFRRDSEKELSFTYQCHEYRTLLKIDCQSGKSEGFIWKDGASEVNGKITEYAKYIKELFGSSNLFLNSVFCGQNADKMSDMTTGELKTLFAEFLRLHELQANEETCKQMINVLTGKASQIETSLEVLRKRTEGAQAKRDDIARLNTLAEEQKAAKADLSEKLTEAQKEREGLKEVIAKNEVLCAQVEQMKTALFDMTHNRAIESGNAETKLRDLRYNYAELAAEIKKIDEILSREFDILLAVEDVKKVTAQIDSLVENIELRAVSITNEQGLIATWEKEIQELNHSLPVPSKDERLANIKFKIHGLAQQVEGYKGQLTALEVRDQECTSKSCSFIVAALKAKDELPAAEDRLAQLIIERENRVSELSAVGVEILNQITAKESLLKNSRAVVAEQSDIQSEKRKMLATARMDLKKYESLSARQSEIAVAKSQKADREKALEENKKQGMTTSAEWTARAAYLDDQRTAQQLKINEITACMDEKAGTTLVAVQEEIRSFGVCIQEMDKALQGSNEQIAALQSELAGIADAEEQFKKTAADKERIMQDVSEWTYLRNACGKNGIQALEIDGAAPLISGYANDLLSQAFGSLYTVKFRTQDDEGKECLDIVTIGEDGEEVLLDNLSGGQKCWVLMALRLAMTLLSKEKSGRNFQTAFFDEMDGALDPDNAVNFINLYKSFMDIGHFEAIPFISHKPECRSMADHVLMFEAGKNPVWQ